MKNLKKIFKIIIFGNNQRIQQLCNYIIVKIKNWPFDLLWKTDYNLQSIKRNTEDLLPCEGLNLIKGIHELLSYIHCNL